MAKFRIDISEELAPILEQLETHEQRLDAVEARLDALENPTLPTLPTLPESRLLTWDGKTQWWPGVNGAWYHYGRDVGGKSSGFAATTLDVNGNVVNDSVIVSRLREAVEAGAKVVNWWLFPFGANKTPPAAIALEGERPIGLTGTWQKDVDAMIKVANHLDFYWSFTIFNQPETWFDSWLPTHKDDMVAAIIPMLEQYATEPRIMSYTVAAEVDFSYWYQGKSKDDVVDVMTKLVAAVKEHTDKLVTVQSAFADSFPLWATLPIDFLSASWYDYMSSGTYCMLCNDAAFYTGLAGKELPVIIHEIYVGGDVLNGAADRWQRVYNKQYAGGWAWMLFSERAYDGMLVDLADMKKFTNALPY